ncbi:MAG: DUF192 domain-containing protein [Gammaproteobacteria bacterium]|nr:DUF192 domain-containing protein [Gammaproteobacteria bacterium]MCP4089858.1 DUF192 domain-containing protein [Gammaproteobacteria bacterium]MCP4928623.1 DUF192 domain-containing protein [Gammaproteobacteria bacterium]
MKIFCPALMSKSICSLFLTLCSLSIFTIEIHAAKPENLLREFPRTQLIINTNNGKCIVFDVYVAQTSAQRSQGLMHIESMGTYEGMIFIYEVNTRISMWMKNTLIPLDMLFLDKTLKIASMHQGAVPHSEKIIQSRQEAIAVIELNGGSIEYFRIKAGDEIIFPAG